MKKLMIATLLLFTMQLVHAQMDVSDINNYVRKAGVENCKQIIVVNKCAGMYQTDQVRCKEERISVSELKIVTNLNSLMLYDEKRLDDSLLISYDTIAYLMKKGERLYIYLKED